MVCNTSRPQAQTRHASAPAIGLQVDKGRAAAKVETVILRYSEGSTCCRERARSFGVPQDDGDPAFIQLKTNKRAPRSALNPARLAGPAYRPISCRNQA